jgi:hypothetical protein
MWGDPAWKFTWLAPHLAITEDALRRSVIGPSRQLANYPETYESAYQSWLRTKGTEHRDVCTTTVALCLR